MKRQLLAILLILAMSITLLSGCKSAGEDEDATISGTLGGGMGGNQQDDETPDEQQKPDGQQEPDEQQKPDEQQTPGEQQKPDDQQNSQGQNNNQDQAKPQEQEKSDEQQKPEEQDTPLAPSPEEPLANLYQSSVLSTAIGYNGKNTKNKDYTVSKAVEVKGGDTITFGPASSAQVVHGFAYDKNGKPLQLINATVLKEVATYLEGMKIYTYSVPAGAASVKMSVHNKLKNEFVLVRNNTFDLTSYPTLSNIPSDFVDNPLNKMHGLFVGDSICIATRDKVGSGWASRIADETGLISVNNGKSGVSVSNKRSQGTVLTQLMEKKTQDFDYVVLHGGVNDAWSLVDVGVMEEGFDPANFDPATFAGGLELLIYNAIATYGDKAAIGYLVNFKAPACEKGTVKEMSAYNKVAMQICDKWGISYFDMYNHEEITKNLRMDTTTHTTDYIHPSASGYDVISPYIADYMRTMTPCTEEMLNKILGK